MTNASKQDIDTVNTIYSVQSYSVSARHDNVTVTGYVQRNNETLLTAKEIKDEANEYFVEYGLKEENPDYLEIEVLELELLCFQINEVYYYYIKNLADYNLNKTQLSPSGLEYKITDFNIQLRDNDTFDIRFIRTWENRLIETVEEELKWNDIFAFHQGRVIEFFSKEHINMETSKLSSIHSA